MKEYLYDVKVNYETSIDANTQEEAENILKEKLKNINVLRCDNLDSVVSEYGYEFKEFMDLDKLGESDSSQEEKMSEQEELEIIEKAFKILKNKYNKQIKEDK